MRTFILALFLTACGSSERPPIVYPEQDVSEIRACADLPLPEQKECVAEHIDGDS